MPFMCSHNRACNLWRPGKTSKQIFKGHVTDIVSILIFLFYFKATMLLLLFSLLNFDFSIFTFWYSIQYLGNINCEILLLAKLGKPCLLSNLWLQLKPWMSCLKDLSKRKVFLLKLCLKKSYFSIKTDLVR